MYNAPLYLSDVHPLDAEMLGLHQALSLRLGSF